MNKWIRRTAGTVGIAGGVLLLGTAAHADNPVTADPQALHDLADSASVDGGLSGVGVSVDTPGQRDTVGLLPDGGGPIRSGTNNGEFGAVLHAPTQDGQPRDVFANGQAPDIFQALPITDVVPTDGLGMPRTLPGGPTEATGVPVRNLPIGTSMAGDTLSRGSLGGSPLGGSALGGSPLGGSSLGGSPLGGSSVGGPSLGGDDLARDGFAGNGLGIPLGDQLPLGAAQDLASQGQSAGGSALGGQGLGGQGLGGQPLGGSGLGGQPLGGQALGGLPLVGGGASGGRAATTPTAQSSRGQSSLTGDAVQVLPTEAFGLGGRHRAEAGLPTAGGLPVLGDVLKGGGLPAKANVNTLPGAPALPVHDLIGPGTSAAGASSGNALNQATGTVGNLAGPAAGGGTEALPIGDEGLPLVGGLTGPTGTRGMPLPDTAGIPVVGGLAGGLTGGKHRAQYDARHAA